jgi:hypothetical protein
VQTRLRQQGRPDSAGLLAKRASACVSISPRALLTWSSCSVLSEQAESQFAALNSRKRARSGFGDQAIAELVSRPGAKLTLSRVQQPSTDRLQALLVRHYRQWAS